MTKVDALEKLRKHLDKRSGHSVKVTERMARYWWNVCNVAIFNNKLYPPEEIEIKKLKDWGYCHVTPDDEVIVCLDSEITTRGLFLSTLVHEMVHQWENETYGRMGHGQRFLQWKERISKSIGLDINTEAYEEEYINGERQIYKRRY